MCRYDFRYFAERYATMQKDGGGVMRFTSPWGSQETALNLISKLELEMVEASQRGEPVNGLMILWHKARQLGATAVGRILIMHRSLTIPHGRCMSASVDDDKIMEMYDRDKLVYDNLPWYLKPDLEYDEKAAHLYFAGLGSKIIYQVGTQKSGMGVGRQFELCHLTECSTWPNAEGMIELDFFPAIPRSRNTLGILESTAYGRGNWWHTFSERVRLGQEPRWRYLFIPWYAELSKYRSQPPVNWQPSKIAMLHAQKVHDTSALYMGHSVMLPRENLYWWDSERAAAQQKGRLNFFLTNYCATPEESFQHSGVSAFPTELLEELRMNASSKAYCMHIV